MLHISRRSKSYGITTILDDVSFVLNRGERAGLVGVNGAGKTTLLRIIAGIEQPDAGFVRLDARATLGYLPQGLKLDEKLTLAELVREGVRAWFHVKRELDELAARLEMEASNVNLVQTYTGTLARFEELGGYDVETRIEHVLRGLGLTMCRANCRLRN